MQTIYAGRRHPEYDEKVFNAVAKSSIKEVAEDLGIAPSTVRAAVKRHESLVTYSLVLLGGG